VESQLLHKVRELSDALKGNTGEPGDLTSILQHIAQTAKKVFAADSCVIFAMNPITSRFITALTIADDLLKENVPYEQSRLEGLAQEVLRQGTIAAEDLQTAPEYYSTFMHTQGTHSFMALALRMKYRQKPLGVIYLNYRQPQQFSLNDHELFQLFVDEASFILQETWLLQRYEEVARIGQEINQELATVDILFQKLQMHVPSILDTSHALLLVVYQPQANTFDLYVEEEKHFIFRKSHLPGGASQYVIKTQQTVFIEQ
jgi:GAF domain-containing protein